jgi:cytochrome P450
MNHAPVIDARACDGFTLAAAPAGFAANPYPWYAALRQHRPVHALAPGVLLLTRHADVSAMYRHRSLSSDKKVEFAPKLGVGTPIYEHHTTSLVFSDPPLHTRVRRLMVGALSQRAIARMQGGLERLVEGLLDDLQDKAARGETLDLIEDFAARIPVDVIGNLLDIPVVERAPLQAWSLAILSALEPTPSAELLARANAATTAFLDQLRTLVMERRRRPGDPEVDILTRLIQGERDEAGGTERLSEKELLHNCIFLLNAGHETTTNLIGNGLHALLSHRGEFERLRAQPEALIGTAVEEMLRLESPLQLNNRSCREPIEWAGQTWPAGTLITLGVGAANRDPAVFANPDVLDIGRKPNPHVGFGHGAHACAGMSVARLEARVAIPRLIQRFPALALTGEAVRDPRIRFRGFRRLPMTV